MDLIKEYGNVTTTSKVKKPFFLYLPFQNVHAPLEVPKKYADLYKNKIKTRARKLYSGTFKTYIKASSVHKMKSNLRMSQVW